MRVAFVRSALVAILSLEVFSACGRGFDEEAAASSLASVTPPVGATENPREPDSWYEGGEMIEIDGCCSAFVYRPDDVHPDGWTGTGDTLAIRYFELVGLPDGTSACRAYADWVGANGAEAEPGCYAPDRQQDMTAVVGPESVTIGDVIYRAQVRVDSSDIRVTFAAITDG